MLVNKSTIFYIRYIHKLWEDHKSKINARYERYFATSLYATWITANFFKENNIEFRIIDGSYCSEFHWFIIVDDFIVDIGNSVHARMNKLTEIEPIVTLSTNKQYYIHKEWDLEKFNDYYKSIKIYGQD